MSQQNHNIGSFSVWHKSLFQSFKSPTKEGLWSGNHRVAHKEVASKNLTKIVGALCGNLNMKPSQHCFLICNYFSIPEPEITTGLFWYQTTVWLGIEETNLFPLRRSEIDNITSWTFQRRRGRGRKTLPWFVSAFRSLNVILWFMRENKSPE